MLPIFLFPLFFLFFDKHADPSPLLPIAFVTWFGMTRCSGSGGSGSRQQSNQEVTTNHVCCPAPLPVHLLPLVMSKELATETSAC
jgi:hypothetical protein